MLFSAVRCRCFRTHSQRDEDARIEEGVDNYVAGEKDSASSTVSIQ